VLRVVSLPNHKEHLALDADSELITAVTVTPGNVADSEEFIALVDRHAREVTADNGYDTDANHQQLKDNGQRGSIIVKKNRTNTEIIGQANLNTQRERRNIERKFAEQGTPLIQPTQPGLLWRSRQLCPSCEGGKNY